MDFPETALLENQCQDWQAGRGNPKQIYNPQNSFSRREHADESLFRPFAFGMSLLLGTLACRLWEDEGPHAVLWLRGRYTSYTDYDTDVVGFFQ